MKNRKFLWVVLAILIPGIIIFSISFFIQPYLPSPWNAVLILCGVVIAAVLAGLSGLNDTVQLIDRLQAWLSTKFRREDKKAEKEQEMQDFVEQVRRQLRLGDVGEARLLLSAIKSYPETSVGEWDKQVELMTELLNLAELSLKSTDIEDTIEKGGEWPQELVACYLAAWNKNDDKEYRAALTKARRLLPVAQINPELQDSLAMVELEIVQREKEMGEFKPVLNWPQPPQHRGVGAKPVSPFIARRILNGRDPFAHEYAEDELPDLFADETKLAFWGGHSLFNALFTVDRVTLVHSVPGNGRTAFAYGLHYFASRREVFALHIPGQPDAQEIQRRYALHLCDFVLAYPGHLRRIAAAEMNLLAHLLATQIGKTVILGRIQSRQVALSARQQTNETKQEHLSARTQLQLLAQKVEAVSPKQDNAVDWVMNGLGTIVYALGFKRAFLILDANTPDSAKYMIETLLPQGLRWQASGFYTIFFLPSTLSLTEPQPRGEFYSWSLTWSLAQIEKAIAWRYRAFTAPKRKILEQFENKDSFDFMLQQCSYNAENLSFIPRKFIQLWHNVTDVLQPDGEITRAAIEQFSRASTHVMPPQAKESDQTEQPITGQVSSETISDPDRETAEQKQLKHILNNYFKLSELQEICFDFGVDYEEFSDRKSQMSLDMVTHFKNSNRLDDLWTAIQKQRPFVRE